MSSQALSKILLSRRMLFVFLMGFASGLPLALIGGTLQAWMTDSNVDIKLITLSTFTGIPYTYKFLWAPAMDRFELRGLGLRRGWILFSQLSLAALLLVLGYSDPGANLQTVAIIATMIAVCGANQDIVIDAYRTEILPDDEKALGASLAILGYRLAMIVSGGMALILAQKFPWQAVYSIMALVMAFNFIVTFFAPEPSQEARPKASLLTVARSSFAEFFNRPGAYEILAFILLYKLADVLAAAPTTPFLMKLGFSKLEIGLVAKSYGLFATIGGAFLGGLAIPKIGMLRALWIFGVLQAVSIASFSFLAMLGPNLSVMTFAITFENLCNGMGTAAFTAFLMNQCRREYTATQYALFTSFMSLNRYIGGALTGTVAAITGWPVFFLLCIASGIPGLALLTRFKKWQSAN